MRSRFFSNLLSVGHFAAGLTLGGLLVGAAEAIYREASVPYAALMYGALWALGGLCAAPVVAALWRWRMPESLTALGAATSMSLSALVLVRFIVKRDILAEAPGSGWKALLAGVAVAAVVGLLAAVIGRKLGRAISRAASAGPRATSYVAPALVLLAYAGLAVRDLDPEASVAPAARPLSGRGVVLVVADTLRADALGVYGQPDHRGAPITPNLDAWAKTARVYTDMSAQASWTRPAMASIMTSRHVSGHDTMSKIAVLPEALPTVATELDKAGVRTAAVVTNYNLEPRYGFARGFDEFTYLAPGTYLGAPATTGRLALYNVYRLLRERYGKNRQARHFYREGDTVNAKGLAALDDIGNGDFFVWLHYMEPHDPYFDADGKTSFARIAAGHPRAEDAEPMRRAYLDNVRRFDQRFGELLAALKARGLAERTTVVFTSDHGEEFFEHGGYFHGTSLYEEQLHVPLIISGPGIEPGREAAIARQIDIAPTILGRLGKGAPTSFEGRDLFGSTAAPLATLAEEDHEGNVLASVRRHEGETRLKLIVANAGNPRGLPERELFDLAADAKEQSRRDDPAARARLEKELDAMRAQAKKGGAQSTAIPMDASAESQLRALGYVQ